MDVLKFFAKFAAIEARFGGQISLTIQPERGAGIQLRWVLEYGKGGRVNMDVCFRNNPDDAEYASRLIIKSLGEFETAIAKAHEKKTEITLSSP